MVYIMSNINLTISAMYRIFFFKILHINNFKRIHEYDIYTIHIDNNIGKKTNVSDLCYFVGTVVLLRCLCKMACINELFPAVEFTHDPAISAGKRRNYAVSHPGIMPRKLSKVEPVNLFPDACKFILFICTIYIYIYNY